MKKRQDAIKALEDMKKQLERQLMGLDMAIHELKVLEYNFDEEEISEPSAPVYEEKKPIKGKLKNTTFESEIDFTKLRSEPDSPWTCPKCGAFNPVGRTTCMECKTKKPEGIRKDI